MTEQFCLNIRILLPPHLLQEMNSDRKIITFPETVTRGDSLLLSSIWSDYLHSCGLKWPWGPSQLQDSQSEALLSFNPDCAVHKMPVFKNHRIEDWGSSHNAQKKKKRTVPPSLLLQSFKWSINLESDNKIKIKSNRKAQKNGLQKH